ncbi:MAG TPA: alanine--tRNA ligase [Fimbriimonadaceae bacterium]|nr:alanine--tRNA ligase [Fimbriimonadaceae bacterium]HRJ33436.1 alanine--tRNA ligase [Fimbriimonadaceae bacterium]
MTARELRQKYLDFFESKGHSKHPSGSLVPIDVTGRLDESLLFNGAGMVQFKPYFRGSATPPNRRLTTSQKCVRTGDIEEVGDLSHLTFFEMLGNFSFGDYFKAEAIAFSWEFLTSQEWLGLDPRRLALTVFEEDDEAFSFWANYLRAAGIDPNHRIFRLGEETNYWPAGSFSSGPPGPCGPNSEMFYWVSNEEPPPSGAYSKEDYLRDEAEGKWLEIWNDVFIQFEWQGELKNPERPADGFQKTGMPPLPFQSIDTGMGLERTAAVLGGFRSVYDTDVFAPILWKIQDLAHTQANLSGYAYGKDERLDVAVRIIADHIRTACFCIADGILPSNAGRGYVLRRLIRRAVLKGQRTLGFQQPFFHEVFEGVQEAMGGHYTELIERRDVIIETLRYEEALFRRTVSQGAELLTEALGTLEARVLPGATAFKLYDTFGFPLEVTREICAEQGILVDEEGYQAAMQEAQERSRASSEMDSVYGGVGDRLMLIVSPNATDQNLFVGYDYWNSESNIVQVSPVFDKNDRSTGVFQIVLDATPFYAESGGQVGDTGVLQSDEFEMQVRRTWKEMGLSFCDVELTQSPWGSLQGKTPEEMEALLKSEVFFRPVRARIDGPRRARIQRHHTATHLLHAALRHVVGKHVTQAGSLVAPDHLRFDFTHGKALTPEELQTVEDLVNEQALRGLAVETYANVPIEEAKAAGAMALFGEKYGDFVRMVRIGDFSLELCGGCHTRHSSDVGLVKIIHEGSVASGVRRIEAVAGENSLEWAQGQMAKLRQAANLLKSNPDDLVAALERTLEQLKDERKKVQKLQSQIASGNAAAQEPIAVGPLELLVIEMAGEDAKEATLVAERSVEAHPKRVAVVGIRLPDKASIVVKCGAEAVAAQAHAGNLVRELARIAGGGGGGQPGFATAGTKDPQLLGAALGESARLLKEQIGG